MHSSGGVEEWAVCAFDSRGDHAGAGSKRDSTDGRSPWRIRDRPVRSTHVRDFAGGENHQCTTSTEPQMRCPKTRQAAFCSTGPVEGVDEEAEIAQLGNVRQQVIREKAYVLPRAADQVEQQQAIKRAVRMVGRDDERSISRNVCDLVGAAFCTNAQNAERARRKCRPIGIGLRVQLAKRVQPKRPGQKRPRGD
jgi:hypothetical protein